MVVPKCYNFHEKKKAIIFDLDGTALDSPKQKLPSARLIKAIRLLIKNYYFCAATGRVWTFAKPLLKSLHLTDPCIISAGTQICDPVTGKILWQKVVAEEALKEVISIFEGNPDYKLLYNDGTEDDYFNGGVNPKDFVAREPVYFLEQVFVPDKIALELYKKLNQVHGITCVMVVSQKPGCRDIHIVNSLATKEHAVGKLLEILEVEKKNTIGVGDGHNDIHLFHATHYKVAMGNAVPELKTIADLTIGTVAKDGLAGYLYSLSEIRI